MLLHGKKNVGFLPAWIGRGGSHFLDQSVTAACCGILHPAHQMHAWVAFEQVLHQFLGLVAKVGLVGRLPANDHAVANRNTAIFGRAGISVDPDQFYLGGHLETSPLFDLVRFRPNVEVGFGEGVTLLAANMEFVYKSLTNRNGWGLYAGGGPALNVYMGDSNTDTEAGVNFLVGIYQARGLFFEFKGGAMDSPYFKFGVGWTFR